MPVKDFLSIRDFTPQQIRHYLHVATQLKAYPNVHIRIGGYTDLQVGNGDRGAHDVVAVFLICHDAMYGASRRCGQIARRPCAGSPENGQKQQNRYSSDHELVKL